MNLERLEKLRTRLTEPELSRLAGYRLLEDVQDLADLLEAATSPPTWEVARFQIDDSEIQHGRWEPIGYAGYDAADRFRETAFYVLCRRRVTS